jgi:hypothetical protein
LIGIQLVPSYGKGKLLHDDGMNVYVKEMLFVNLHVGGDGDHQS